jgi:Na+/H+ antiporter NhaD/arsenite permease-like protein
MGPGKVLRQSRSRLTPLNINTLTYLIFILSYVLIASRRLSLLPIGRPAGVLLGAFLMVAVGTNLLSNVPMVLLTGPHLGELGNSEMGWVLLAYITTVPGNLTLLGSVANIIVAERARDQYALGFLEYLRFGFPSTLIVLGVGVALIYRIMS